MSAAELALGPTPAERMAAELAADDRDAIMLWLVHSGAADRTELASRLLIGSVFAQAGLLGLVSCTRCGDRGCDWCGGAS